jgi:hypothetical protein
MPGEGDVEATRYGRSRFGARGQARVVNAASLLYGQARHGVRGAALGVFDATSGGMYGTGRTGVRGVARVISTAPVYFAARFANRGMATVLAGNAQIPEATPQPPRIHRLVRQIATAGVDEAEIVTGGARAAQIVVGGRNA